MSLEKRASRLFGSRLSAIFSSNDNPHLDKREGMLAPTIHISAKAAAALSRVPLVKSGHSSHASLPAPQQPTTQASSKSVTASPTKTIESKATVTTARTLTTTTSPPQNSLQLETGSLYPTTSAVSNGQRRLHRKPPPDMVELALLSQSLELSEQDHVHRAGLQDIIGTLEQEIGQMADHLRPGKLRLASAEPVDPLVIQRTPVLDNDTMYDNGTMSNGSDTNTMLALEATETRTSPSTRQPTRRVRLLLSPATSNTQEQQLPAYGSRQSSVHNTNTLSPEPAASPLKSDLLEYHDEYVLADEGDSEGYEQDSESDDGTGKMYEDKDEMEYEDPEKLLDDYKEEPFEREHSLDPFKADYQQRPLWEQVPPEFPEENKYPDTYTSSPDASQSHAAYPTNYFEDQYIDKVLTSDKDTDRRESVDECALTQSSMQQRSSNYRSSSQSPLRSASQSPLRSASQSLLRSASASRDSIVRSPSPSEPFLFDPHSTDLRNLDGIPENVAQRSPPYAELDNFSFGTRSPHRPEQGVSRTWSALALLKNYHARVLLTSSITSGGSRHLTLATLKRAFSLRPGEGERSTYVQTVRKNAGTAYNETGPGKWKLPTGILPVDRASLYLLALTKYKRSAARAKKASGVELKHGHLQPRLLAAEVDDGDTPSRFGSLGQSSTGKKPITPITSKSLATSAATSLTGSTMGSSIGPAAVSRQSSLQGSSTLALSSTNDAQSVSTGISTAKTSRDSDTSSVNSNGSLSEYKLGEGYYQHQGYKYEDDGDSETFTDESTMDPDYQDEDDDKPRLVLANPDESSGDD